MSLHPIPRTDHVNEIIATIVEIWGVPEDLLLSKTRLSHISGARQAVYMLCRDLLDLSYPSIGRMLGARDHTTVMSGIAAARRRSVANVSYRSYLRRALSKLAGVDDPHAHKRCESCGLIVRRFPVADLPTMGVRKVRVG